MREGKEVCPNCGRPAYMIEVHGHVQCSLCRVNVDPCCGGERCEWTGDDAVEKDKKGKVESVK